ncbi:MAG: IMP dehydrogenase [Flavobacteriales bacterium]|jgi:IMP dehydrogenase|uniref:IMP dehydrogenase n=1 Tax=Blattabacterium sp. (Mastotermes darwiniensis) TaxID=39768 RepID=UPI000231DEB4|nr:IMP dehydrogenase [Blattabacterium sp. (Mastotermes darwiniensis)]AER40744.1 Inosine-5'-monophosphate dehydrogenase [Blattabacterium sp. (Mastotermes darwiniensis) str. MADAR]MDR1805127.1 IMP dehydrogenase [Flavobacteriales bacterium]
MNKKILKEALTFDDVLLVPSYSSILPSEVSLKTSLTFDITLNIPILSSAMDTVTESSLAISIAREGGIGIIHKNMNIKNQSEEVYKVKRSESGMIDDPITLSRNSTLREARFLMNTYHISGLPVVEKDHTLVGIITNRDIKYRMDLDSLVEDVMTKENLITSTKKNITLEKAKNILLKERIEKLPIVDDFQKLVGLITIRDIDNLIEYPNACKDSKGRLRVGAAVGTDKNTLDRVEALMKFGVDLIVIDSAHGHSIGVLKTIKSIRNNFPKLTLVAGNVVTRKAAKDLIDAGSTILKVGIGSGSICTTRVIAGVGMPQITAINDVYEYAKTRNVNVISDGGIRYSGDIVKAIAAGASSVMIGSLFAGTDEAPGEEIIFQGRKFKTYVGMGSLVSMKKGSGDRYFHFNEKYVPEGIEARVPYRGAMKDVIYQICGGLRSGMGYCGVSTIKELMIMGKFVRITNSGLKENHPHSVSITKESPNYFNYCIK